MKLVDGTHSMDQAIKDGGKKYSGAVTNFQKNSGQDSLSTEQKNVVSV